MPFNPGAFKTATRRIGAKGKKTKVKGPSTAPQPKRTGIPIHVAFEKKA